MRRWFAWDDFAVGREVHNASAQGSVPVSPSSRAVSLIIHQTDNRLNVASPMTTEDADKKDNFAYTGE